MNAWARYIVISGIACGGLPAQTVFNESFTGRTAPGWVFGGNYTPNLTANTVDAPGDGWLRLTDSANNRATYAFLDTEIFSVNAQINITMEYAFYNGSGADGITFFLVDGDTTAASFDPGSYGGSMGYAQRTGEAGMAGGYLGFAFDNYGNYANSAEGRNGGLSNGGLSTGTLHPNVVAVRGPESSNYEFIAASDPLPQQMDFPTSVSRLDQTGADYRSFQIVLDANNQLEVFMKFGATNLFQSVFTADLSSYQRPDTFKLGFTGATGGSTEIHEIRNLQVTTTPFQAGAFEWDDGGASDNNAATSANWVGDVLPTDNADILFGSKPTAHSTQPVVLATDIRVRSLTFDSSSSYQLGGDGEITLGNSLQNGLPSINVNEYNNAYARHKIDNDLRLAEQLRINNYSLSTLCLNGTLLTHYDDNLGSSSNATTHDIIVGGQGAVNFNGDIVGSGNLVKNNVGITTLNNNNADGSSWSGNVTINGGQVVVTANGALGNTTGTTTVKDGATLAFRGGVNYTVAEAVSITGRGIERGFGQSAGALHNDGSNNAFAGGITLTGDAAVGSREGVLTLSGNIGQNGGNRSLTKVGAGVVSLGGTNSYTGPTRIEEGALRVTAATALAGGNLQLNGGVLEVGADLNGGSSGDFSRNLGTGNSNIAWTGDGGFSAHGGDRTVRLNNGTGTLAWGSTSNFVGNGHALLLGSDYADSTLTLANSLTLSGGQREVRVANGTAAVDGALSGRLRGTGGGLVKTGEGTLALTRDGSASDYSGATEIRGGALRVTNADAFSNNSNLQLAGGVFENAYTTTFTQTLGTGGDNVRWLGDGGFSAAGADRTVRLNNSTDAITWGGTTHFVGANNALIFGSRSADATLIWDKAINLGGGTRTLRIIDGVADTTRAEARFSQALSNGNLNIEGDGRLDIGATNGSLAGTVAIGGAELRLNTGGTMTAVSSFTVSNGGAFTLDNAGTSSSTSGGTNHTDRIGNSADITLSGGSLHVLGAATASSETIGALHLSGGANTITGQRNGTNSAVLTATSLNRTDSATVNFTSGSGGGTLGASGTNPRVVLTTAPPTLANGILAYATVNGESFATHGTHGITAAATTTGTWEANKNIAITANGSLGFDINRQVNSIVISNGASMNFAGRNVDVVSGGILAHGTSSTSFTGGGTLTSSSGELITHVYGTGGLTIQNTITNSGATPVGLTKAGNGTLTLSGSSANTHTGLTRVQDGTLLLAKTDGVAALGGDLSVGDGRGVDTVRFINNEQLNFTADVTLRGGLTDASASNNHVAVLDLNGTTQTFDAMVIRGNSVIDFSGGDPCSPTFLNINSLTFVGDATLTIRNWIEFTDFFLVANTAVIDFSRIVFEGYGSQANWQHYSTGWNQLTPVPEPGTYGALLLGSTTAFAFLRRRRR